MVDIKTLADILAMKVEDRRIGEAIGGWDLVTSRPLTDEQRQRADDQARREAEDRGGKPKKAS